MDLDTDASQFANFDDPASWYNVAGAFFCVLCAALAAGLTVVCSACACYIVVLRVSLSPCIDHSSIEYIHT